MDSKQENELPKTITAREVLDDANRVRQDRGRVYGHPYIQMDRAARIASATLGIPITPDQVALFYACGKLSRIAETAGARNRDSYVDACAYIALALELATTDPLDFYDDDQS